MSKSKRLAAANSTVRTRPVEYDRLNSAEYRKSEALRALSALDHWCDNYGPIREDLREVYDGVRMAYDRLVLSVSEPKVLVRTLVEGQKIAEVVLQGDGKAGTSKSHVAVGEIRLENGTRVIIMECVKIER